MLILLVTTASCYKDRLGFDKIAGGSINPLLAVPITYGDLGMQNVIDNSSEIWKEYPDGLLSIVFVGDTVSNIASDIISFPNQTKDTSISFAIPPGMFPGDSASSPFFLVKGNFQGDNNERLDSVLVKDGYLDIEITTNINHSSSVVIIIPQITKYGSSFYQKLNIPYTGGTSNTVNVSVHLQDYYINFNQNAGSPNEVVEYVKIYFVRGNGADNSPYSFDIKQTIRSFDYYEVYGYFHQKTFTIDQTDIPISIFDNSHYSDILLEDPELRMIFANSIGIPLALTFTDLYVEKNGVRMDITSPQLPTLPLNSPDFSNIGGYDTTRVVFNSSNSNIKDIVNFNPHKLVYKGNVLSNPTSTVVPNYVFDTSNVGVRLELEVPLYGRAMSFTMQDTSVFELGEDVNIDDLESIDLNINALNYFPLDAKLQLYLADSNSVVFDSIFSGQKQVITSAVPGIAPDYRVSDPIHFMTTISLSDHKLQSLKKAENIIISATAQSYNQGSKLIKIYSDYKIFVELSAKGKYKIDF
jgi:hypothetical protein